VILLVKIAATPLLIAAATLVQRRFGPAVGGWLVGFPLTSGPVSLFLAIEQGPSFAAEAALATIAGLTPVLGFCLAYFIAAQKHPWPFALVLALSVYAVAAILLQTLGLTGGIGVAVFGAAFVIVLVVCPRVKKETPNAPPPAWDLPYRMAAATALVLTLTGAAEILGPALTGLVSPFPVFGAVLCAFSHRTGGGEAAQATARGIILGSAAFIPFFAIVHWWVEALPLALCYALAAIAAMGLNAALLALAWRRIRI